MEHCDCTQQCKSRIHGDLISCVLTKKDIEEEELCSYINQICYCCESVRDNDGRTALHVAASVGKTKVVKWLLQRKHININAKDYESGYTALHRSLYYGRIDTATTLLQAGIIILYVIKFLYVTYLNIVTQLVNNTHNTCASSHIIYF